VGWGKDDQGGAEQDNQVGRGKTTRVGGVGRPMRARREDRGVSQPHIFYRLIWIYLDFFDRGFVSKSLSLDMIRSCHVMYHMTYKPFDQWHVTLGESCHSHTDIRDWIDKPRA
jgi:hypothetical protein